MRKTAAALLLVLFLASSLTTINPAHSTNTTPTENTWTQKTPMHQARCDLGVAVVDGKIYAIGGRAPTDNSTRPKTQEVGTNEQYDPATDTWTYKASMPTPAHSFPITVYNNKIYCFGNAKTQVYDPTSDTWEYKTSPPSESGWWAFVLNEKIYVMGCSNVTEIYDTTKDIWTETNSMPNNKVAAGLFDEKIFIIQSYFDGPNPVTKTQTYDPSTDNYTLGATSPTFFLEGYVYQTAGLMAPKRIYVFDLPYGDIMATPNDPFYSFLVYDPQNNSWFNGATCPTSRREFGVAVVDDKIYVIGGFQAAYVNYPDDWMYGPQSTWYSTNEEYLPFGYGTVPPKITVVLPENTNYSPSSISLTFSVNKPVDWMGYSLDGGDNVTVSGNTTLAELALGSHNVTVYARDSLGNMGASQTVTFMIFSPPSAFFETFPILPFAVLIAAIAIACVSTVFISKRKKQRVCRLVEAEPTSRYSKKGKF